MKIEVYNLMQYQLITCIIESGTMNKLSDTSLIVTEATTLHSTCLQNVFIAPSMPHGGIHYTMLSVFMKLNKDITSEKHITHGRYRYFKFTINIYTYKT